MEIINVIHLLSLSTLFIFLCTNVFFFFRNDYKFHIFYCYALCLLSLILAITSVVLCQGIVLTVIWMLGAILWSLNAFLNSV